MPEVAQSAVVVSLVSRAAVLRPHNGGTGCYLITAASQERDESSSP
jgi:hypothetical protein